MNVLRNECALCPAWTPSSGLPTPATEQFIAIWDTGATQSVITQAVIDKCGLVATGMTKVHGVHGAQDVETFLVNIGLPNQVMFTGLPVTKGDLVGGDVLIGMDIINQGDFAISNRNGVTKFTFRTPSVADFDFVAENNRHAVAVPSHGGQDKVRKKRPQTYGKDKKKRRK